MRLPWPRQPMSRRPSPAGGAGWTDPRLWSDWEAPRNYVVCEHAHVAALREIAGPAREDRCCFATAVAFVREPDNPQDANAFRAEVEGRQVGYLRRHLAVQLAEPCDRADVRAFEVCGLVRGGSTQTGSLGVHVWLDRTLTPGLTLAVPPEDEDRDWAVPWPPHESEVSGS
jgi:hypothetical protein